jgi:hypothetical protein
MNTTAYVAPHRTATTVELASPEGRKFLRRVASKRGWREGWRLVANANEGWLVTFWRHEDAKAVGDSSRYVDVVTDERVSVHGKTGTVKPGSDGRDVIVPSATSVSLISCDASLAARLLLDGWKLSIRHSAGSQTSSKVGLAFVQLIATPPEKDGVYCCGLSLGGETVTQNGVTVCGGAVVAR